MKLLNKEEAKRICDRVIGFSKADECSVSIVGTRTGNIRYAQNSVSTAGLNENMQLAVTVSFGKRVGTATINEFDEKSLEKVVRRAEDVARLAPENPEFMPAIGKQEFRASSEYSAATAAIDPDFRAQVASHSILSAREKKLVTAGFFIDTTGFEAIANSNGVFGHRTFTDLNFTCTARTEDGRGSGWVTRSANDVARFDAKEASAVAIDKALASVEAKALEPGRYTVILEPAAASGLLTFMFGGFDARQSDEGRSFLSKKGGGNRLGEKLFDEKVNIWTDPWDKDAPAGPWDSQTMLPRERRDLIKDGKVAALGYSRFWAKKQGAQPTAQPGTSSWREAPARSSR
jgi:predicted Zn-dependent protease